MLFRSLKPGGKIVISSCSGQVGTVAFFTAVQQAAAHANRSLRVIAKTGHPSDHPIAFPESAYLKCFFAVEDAKRRR